MPICDAGNHCNALALRLAFGSDLVFFYLFGEVGESLFMVVLRLEVRINL